MGGGKCFELGDAVVLGVSPCFKKVGKDKSYVHRLPGWAGGMVLFRGSFGSLPPAPHFVPAAVGSTPEGVLCFFW